MQRKTITVHGKEFEMLLTASKINDRVKAIGEALSSQDHEQPPMYFGVLNGAFIFFSDLIRHVAHPLEIHFLRYQSYQATQSTGTVKTFLGFDEKITGRDIVIVEDILDTGLTLKHLLADAKQYSPNSITVVTFVSKPSALAHDVKADHVGFEIDNKFVVGYGLDYDQHGRNFSDLYVLKE